jgi:hypothetical protein
MRLGYSTMPLYPPQRDPQTLPEGREVLGAATAKPPIAARPAASILSS